MITAMIFILWMIMFMMLFGFLGIVVTELTIDLIKDDTEKLQAEAFLMAYYDKDFGGKVQLILLTGGLFIGQILFFWTKQNRGDEKNK